MFKNEISQRKKVILTILLIILNIMFRIPSITHETGNDSYQIHALANSISQSGTARWWASPLSIFGLYTYSYSSAVPFFLSGMSQVLSMDMEKTILLYCSILGLLSVITAYLMAGVFYNSFLFKYIFAFLFSTSQAVLQFTLFDASTRGMFLVIFPLAFYLLLKKNQPCKKFLLLIIYLIFLRSVHNFSYFALPLVFTALIIYFGSKIKVMMKNEIKIIGENERLKILQNLNLESSYVILILFSLLAPFFMKLFVVGSRYQYLIDIFITTARYVGPLILLTLAGIIYTLMKKEKSFTDWFILISLLFFIPISYSSTYGKFIIVPFVIFFIAVGLENILLISRNKQFHSLIIVLIIISSALFSSYYNHHRSGASQSYWYMDESINEAGIWTRSSIPEDTHIYTTVGEVWRMLAVSNGHIQFPSLPPLELVYGFVNKSDVLENSERIPSTSLNYYFEGPYIQKSKTDKLGEYYWVMQFDINDERVKDFMKKYNIKYIVYDTYADRGQIIGSVESNNNLIFDNSRVKIWLV